MKIHEQIDYKYSCDLNKDQHVSVTTRPGSESLTFYFGGKTVETLNIEEAGKFIEILSRGLKVARARMPYTTDNELKRILQG